MKKLLVPFLLFISVASYAQTNVSGLITTNTNWTLSGSPYIVVGSILLDTGAVLLIEPGVIVKIDSNNLMQIRGTLRAIGTQSNPITFTSNDSTPAPGDWENILFEDESISYDTSTGIGSILKNCIVEYGGSDGAIKTIGSSPLFDSCTIRYNSSHGLNIENMFSGQDDPVIIRNCNAHDNGGSGIGVSASASEVLVEYNILERNGWYGLGVIGRNSIVRYNVVCDNVMGGIGMGGNNNDSSVFHHNIVLNHTQTFSYAVNFDFITNHKVVVRNNIFAQNESPDDACIKFQGGDNAIYYQNQIVNNSSPTILWLVGGGITNNPSVYNNTIAGNNLMDGVDKFHVINDTFPSTVNIYQYPKMAFNNIFASNTGTSPFYHIENYNYNTAPDLTVDSNYLWGSTSNSQIDPYVLDWFDDNTWSLLYYSPFLTSPDTIAPISPPANVTKTDLGGGNVQINWDSNLETDLAGYKLYWTPNSCYSFTNMLDLGIVDSFILSGVSITDTIAVTAYDNSIDGTDDQLDGNESWYSYNDSLVIDTTSNTYAESLTLMPRLRVYPNPNSGRFTLEMDLQEETKLSIKFYHFTGQLIHSEEIGSVIGNYTQQIDLNEQSKGMYFLHVLTNYGLVTRKIVVH